MTLTQSALKAVLHYDETTGKFTRTYNGSGVRAGQEAGRRHGQYGHIKIAVKQKRYFAHRLAWLYVYGRWPEMNIDHINGDPADNRIANLREVDQATNMQNQRRAHTGSSTGLIGASRRKNGRFVSQIQLSGKVFNLGTFDKPEEAHARYVEAKRQMHAGGML